VTPQVDAEFVVEEPAGLALRERTPEGVIVLVGEALPEVVVEETHAIGVLDVRPPRRSQRAEGVALHRLVREHDVPLPNRLGQVVCRVGRRAFDSGAASTSAVKTWATMSGSFCISMPVLSNRMDERQLHRQVLLVEVRHDQHRGDVVLDGASWSAILRTAHALDDDVHLLAGQIEELERRPGIGRERHKVVVDDDRVRPPSSAMRSRMRS